MTICWTLCVLLPKAAPHLSPQVSDRLLQRIQRGDLDSKPTASALSGLSPRELQVLRLVAEGKTSKEIAVMLDLGLQTVRSYRKTMMKKLGVNNVAGLTQVALAAGITRFPGPGTRRARPVMETPWGALAVSDAHIHFFSHRFFATLAEQKKAPVDSLAPVLGWHIARRGPENSGRHLGSGVGSSRASAKQP